MSNLKRYTVGIQEMEVYHFTVDAASRAEALRLAEKDYDAYGLGNWNFQHFSNDHCFIVDEQEVQS